jgi:hypothetical protein
VEAGLKPRRRRHISGVGDGEGTLGCVVVDGRAEELVGDWVGLNVIEGRQGRDKEIEVGAIGVLDTEIVDYDDKGYRAGKVMEEARGGRLNKARLAQERD